MSMGAAEYNALVSLLKGNVGVFLGLVLTLFGLYQILVARKTGLGLIMLAVGVSLSFVGNFIGGLQEAACPVIRAFGGECTNFVQSGGNSNLQI